VRLADEGGPLTLAAASVNDTASGASRRQWPRRRGRCMPPSQGRIRRLRRLRRHRHRPRQRWRQERRRHRRHGQRQKRRRC
jgi:hypothetical protein